MAIEVVGVSERLERLRQETRQALAQLTADNAMTLAGQDIKPRLDPVLTSRFLMGGVVEVLLEWINGDLDAPADEVVEHFTALFTRRPTPPWRGTGRPPASPRARRMNRL